MTDLFLNSSSDPMWTPCPDCGGSGRIGYTERREGETTVAWVYHVTGFCHTCGGSGWVNVRPAWNEYRAARRLTR